MDEFGEKLKKYMKENSVNAECLSFKQSCHSVEEAAKATNASKEDFVKNICMVDAEGDIIVAIVKGENRASTSRVAKAFSIEKPRIATPEEILGKTGYPCGGVPSFGFNARFIIDRKVMERKIVISSGGSEKSLIRISPKEIQRANNGRIARARK